MKNILLKVEYDGSEFHGWQRQPHLRTAQGELENALSIVCHQPITVDGTSRTDAGVHALGQMVTFQGDFKIPVANLKRAVNDVLSKGGNYKGKSGAMRIVDASEVDLDFHARFNSVGKKYKYIIDCGNEPDLFKRNYVYTLPKSYKHYGVSHDNTELTAADCLNVDDMIIASREIIGKHDFASFQAAGGTPGDTTVRTIYALNIQPDGRYIIINIIGNGFLYNMVRIIVGTLIEIGAGRKNPSQISDIINSKDRANAGFTAPAEGLFLDKVYYNENDIIKDSNEYTRRLQWTE